MPIDNIAWLSQDVTLPLWAVLALLVLPVGYVGRLLRRVIEARLPIAGGGDDGE